jgi:hypothetical protein
MLSIRRHYMQVAVHSKSKPVFSSQFFYFSIFIGFLSLNQFFDSVAAMALMTLWEQEPSSIECLA